MLDAKNFLPFHCVFAKKYKTSYPLVKYVLKVQWYNETLRCWSLISRVAFKHVHSTWHIVLGFFVMCVFCHTGRWENLVCEACCSLRSNTRLLALHSTSTNFILFLSSGKGIQVKILQVHFVRNLQYERRHLVVCWWPARWKSVGLTDRVVTLCFTLIPVIGSSLCAEFMFTSLCMCMHSFCPVEQLVIERVISMATT
jgi:hypothetical protein